MFIAINRDSKTPLYVQLYQELKELIYQKTFETNEKLPSKRQLAQKNKISENTVVNAYEQLLIEGYIYSIERKGYYVSDIQFHSPPLPFEKEISRKQEPKKEKNLFTYDFTRSNPDHNLFPYTVFSKLYRQLFQSTDDQLIAESDSQGLYPLREQLQKYLSLSRGVPCSPEQIILGPSSEYLLSILFQLIDVDIHLGLENPGYQGFEDLIDRSNIAYSPIPVSKKGLNLNELSQSAVNLMIVTSNHQFPRGNIMPLKKRQKLLAWANQLPNRYIIENDYDSEFKYSGIPIPSLKYLDKNNRVLHLGSFTRLLSPGIRLSYMVLPDKLISRYQELFSKSSSNLSSFEQWIIYKFMAGDQFSSHLNRSRTFYKKKRDKLIQAIKKQDPYAVIHGEKAGLHLLVQPSTPFDGLLFKELAAKNKIKLTLLNDYFIDDSQQVDEEKSIFISFSSIPEEKIDEVIKVLFEIIQITAIK